MLIRNGTGLPRLNTNHTVTVEVKNILLHVITYAYFIHEIIINVFLCKEN